MAKWPCPLHPTPRLLDALLAVALGLLAGAIVLAASRQIDPRLANPHAGDVWFASDIPYRLEVMREPGGWENGGAHPLFPSIGHALLAVTAPLARGSDPMRKAAVAGALAAGLFVAVLYALFRRMRLPRSTRASSLRSPRRARASFSGSRSRSRSAWRGWASRSRSWSRARRTPRGPRWSRRASRARAAS